jgi:DNA-binding IclR family transcriptional regulator
MAKAGRTSGRKPDASAVSRGGAGPNLRNGSEKLQGIQSVETGVAVLTVLVEGGGPMTLGEVARGAGLSLSQARRYLVSLGRCGLTVQDFATGRYDLGSRSLQIGLAALARVEAIDLATAALKELVAKIHEAGTLAVWGDDGPTIIRWFRRGGIGVTSMGLGTIFPLLSSATGHVFLTYLSEDITRSQLERELGTKTVSPEIRSKIAAVKAGVQGHGFAWLKGHFVENIRGAGAPIFDSQGELVAVLAIAGPERARTGEQDVSVKAMVEAAAHVSRQLCYRPAPSAPGAAVRRG